MSDTLVSPPVFVTAGVLSLGLLGLSVYKLKHPSKNSTTNDNKEELLPLMGVLGAFIFAAQIIHFSIPGTGSSGHIVGGILLAAVLGPWAAFLTLSAILILQCLLLAAGGVMALGCNIFNMAALSTLAAYPLIFRPLMHKGASLGRILSASVLASAFALVIGALAVTLETEASDITALPLGQFLWFMLPIHLVLGIFEGLATTAVLYVVQLNRPELLVSAYSEDRPRNLRSIKLKHSLVGILLAALPIGVRASGIGSSHSSAAAHHSHSTKQTAVAHAHHHDHEHAHAHAYDHAHGHSHSHDHTHMTQVVLEGDTSSLQEYDTSFSGVIGCSILIIVALLAAYL